MNASLFVSLYQAPLSAAIDPAEMRFDRHGLIGQQWCEDNAYPGYVLCLVSDLPWRADLVASMAVAAFADDLAFDLDDRPLPEDLWINILPEGGFHAAHIHPHSVISGTTYVSMPEGASALKLEDPRHAMMMAAPGAQTHRRRCGTSSM